jgi:hypothetical protein
MQTEIEFTLPRGFLDSAGQVHRQGVMRLATALDEVSVQADVRGRANEAYIPLLLLSRVITRLGSLPAVNPGVLESMFASDYAYLQDLYLRMNSAEPVTIMAACPHCGGQFQLQVAPLEG